MTSPRRHPSEYIITIYVSSIAYYMYLTAFLIGGQLSDAMAPGRQFHTPQLPYVGIGLPFLRRSLLRRKYLALGRVRVRRHNSSSL